MAIREGGVAPREGGVAIRKGEDREAAILGRVTDLYEEDVRRLAETFALLAKLVARPVEDLAADSGLEAGEIEAVLDGTSRLEIAHLLGLCKALRIHPAELFTLAYPRPASPRGDIRRLMERAQRALGIPVPGEEDEEDADDRVK